MIAKKITFSKILFFPIWDRNDLKFFPFWGSYKFPLDLKLHLILVLYALVYIQWFWPILSSPSKYQFSTTGGVLWHNLIWRYIFFSSIFRRPEKRGERPGMASQQWQSWTWWCHWGCQRENAQQVTANHLWRSSFVSSSLTLWRSKSKTACHFKILFNNRSLCELHWGQKCLEWVIIG